MALRLRQSVRQQPIEKANRAKIPLWLDHAVRELLQDEKGPFFIAAPFATKLDDIATEVHRGAPEDLAQLGFAVAQAIDAGTPDDLAGRIAAALRSAKSPLIVSGPSCRSVALVEAAAQLAEAFSAKLAYCLPECNSVGLALLGARPLSEAFRAEAETIIVLENDLYRRSPTPDVDALLNAAQHVVALDHLANATTAKAEIVLPAGTFAETDGTLVNYEGRAQRFFQAFVPSGEIRASWRWLSGNWHDLDEIVSAIAHEIPSLAAIQHAAPSRTESGKVAREPNRYSGRTSMLANISVHEPNPPQDPDSALAFSMESGPQPPQPPLIPFFWAPGWNSIQSVNKFQSEIGGHLRGGDPGIRLIEPGRQPITSSQTPPAFQPEAGDWLILPAFHIFGSEELSLQAPGIAELAPRPYIALNPADAEQLNAGNGDLIKVNLGNSSYHLEASLRSDVPRGIAPIPAAILASPAGASLTLAAAVSETK